MRRITLTASAIGLDDAVVQGFVHDFMAQDWFEPMTAVTMHHLGEAMDLVDRASLYVLVRALSPDVCVETGAGMGASATTILSEMLRKGHGRLYSIDLAGHPNYEYGILIPDEFQAFWELRLQQRGVPELPRLLRELDPIDLFFHDSICDFKQMRWEYETAWPSLRPGGCLASHDVIYTTAFEDFRKAHAAEISGGGTIGNFGFLIKCV